MPQELKDTNPFSAFLSFLKKYPSLHYKKGETLLRPNDAVQGIFILQKGYVKLAALSAEGEELILIVYKENDFFPMLWAFKGEPNRYYFEAMTPVEVKRLPREAFLQFVKEHPEVLVELTGRLMVRLGGLLERMEYLVFGSAHQRVASILLILGERFGKKEESQIVVDCPFTHRDLANLVGIARETASSIMSSFLKKGEIGYKGRMLVIKNKRGLLAESLLTS